MTLQLNRVTIAGNLGNQAVRLRVVTGVPVAVYQDTPDIEQRIAHSLLGNHRYRYNGQPRALVVEAVR